MTQSLAVHNFCLCIFCLAVFFVCLITNYLDMFKSLMTSSQMFALHCRSCRLSRWRTCWASCTAVGCTTTADSSHSRCRVRIQGAGLAFKVQGWHSRRRVRIQGAGFAFNMQGLHSMCRVTFKVQGSHPKCSVGIQRAGFAFKAQVGCPLISLPVNIRTVNELTVWVYVYYIYSTVV